MECCNPDILVLRNPDCAGTLGFDSLRAMLSDKQMRNYLYLSALHVGGVMQRMPPSVLATLFEHAQMLHAAAGMLEYQRNLEGAASDMDAMTQGNNRLSSYCRTAIRLPAQALCSCLRILGHSCNTPHLPDACLPSMLAYLSHLATYSGACVLCCRRLQLITCSRRHPSAQ